MLLDTEVEQGNRIVKKDITDHSYTIEGNTKSGRCFYSKATCKKTYERDIIVIVKLEYTDSVKQQAEEIIDKNIIVFHIIHWNNENKLLSIYIHGLIADDIFRKIIDCMTAK